MHLLKLLHGSIKSFKPVTNYDCSYFFVDDTSAVEPPLTPPVGGHLGMVPTTYKYYIFNLP